MANTIYALGTSWGGARLAGGRGGAERSGWRAAFLVLGIPGLWSRCCVVDGA